jgi:hypothetical protein
VSFEELRNASEEKDSTILELYQAVKTMREDLETEKKQIKGKSPLSILCLSLGLTEIRFRPTFFLLSDLWISIGMSTTQVEALQAA